MPWSSARFVDLDEKATPSFLPNNLCADGRGRFAFAHGQKVQCTRKHDKKQGRNDFSLAMKVDDCQVTSLFFWKNSSKFSRPLLVVATDSSTKTGHSYVQVWDTRSGRGARVFDIPLNALDCQVSFARGIGSSVSEHGTPTLFIGVSTGAVLAYQINKKGQLNNVCSLKGLTCPVQSVSGDCSGLPTVAASDESGHVVTWMHREGAWDRIHKVSYENDYCTALSLKGHILISGHASGHVRFHDITRGMMILQLVTNAKAVTCLDVHPSLDVVMVGGEDCRVTVVKIPDVCKSNAHILLSVCQNAAVLGGVFTCSRQGRPDIALLLLERPYLVKYDYEDGADRKLFGW